MAKRYIISDEVELKAMLKKLESFEDYLDSRYPIENKAKELWFNNVYLVNAQLVAWIKKTIKYLEEQAYIESLQSPSSNTHGK